jgi:AcrR family transcriptional regulator
MTTTPSEPRIERSYHHGDLRRSLLVAAEAELEEKGIEGFSLRGCAKRAGVSHAAPAHHFGDVSGLLAALAAEGFDRFMAAITARQQEADPRDEAARLVKSGLGYVAFARDNPALFNLMFTSKRPDFGEEHLSRAAAAAFAQLVDGVGAVRADDALRSPEGRRDMGHGARSRQPRSLGTAEVHAGSGRHDRRRADRERAAPRRARRIDRGVRPWLRRLSPQCDRQGCRAG